MKNLIFLIVPAMLVFWSCEKENDLQPKSNQTAALQIPTNEKQSVAEGKQYVLEVNKSVMVPHYGVAITFTDVTEDSRCPTGVNCFWEGRAVVKFNFARRGGYKEALLATRSSQPDPPDNIDVFGLNVRLVEVAPYPSERDPNIPLEKYRVTIAVEPANGSGSGGTK